MAIEARVDIRSLICLERSEWLIGDRVRAVVVADDPDGGRRDQVWPSDGTAAAKAWDGLHKWKWAFTGDVNAIHAWSGVIDDGQALTLSVYLVRVEAGADAEVLRAFAEATRKYGPVAVGIAARAVAHAALPAGGGLASRLARSAAGPAAKVGADALIDVLRSEAVSKALGDGRGGLVGAIQLSVAAEAGELVPTVRLGEGVAMQGWWRGVRYPSPSKSGKTLRLCLEGASAKYGLELQVRNMERRSEELPNGACVLWWDQECEAAEELCRDFEEGAAGLTDG